MTFEQRGPRELRDAYRFPGFTPSRAVRGEDVDPRVVVVTLHRRQKKRPAESVARSAAHGMISGYDTSAICRAARCMCDWRSRCGAWRAARAVA